MCPPCLVSPGGVQGQIMLVRNARHYIKQFEGESPLGSWSSSVRRSHEKWLCNGGEGKSGRNIKETGQLDFAWVWVERTQLPGPGSSSSVTQFIPPVVTLMPIYVIPQHFIMLLYIFESISLDCVVFPLLFLFVYVFCLEVVSH